jgi:hypothetical protein
MAKHIFDLLPAGEQDNLLTMEYWTDACDGECASTEWGDGPRYLGLHLLDWVTIADALPQLIELCGMEGPVERWRANHPGPVATIIRPDTWN